MAITVNAELAMENLVRKREECIKRGFSTSAAVVEYCINLLKEMASVAPGEGFEDIPTLGEAKRTFAQVTSLQNGGKERWLLIDRDSMDFCDLNEWDVKGSYPLHSLERNGIRLNRLLPICPHCGSVSFCDNVSGWILTPCCPSCGKPLGRPEVV